MSRQLHRVRQLVGPGGWLRGEHDLPPVLEIAEVAIEVLEPNAHPTTYPSKTLRR